MAEMVWKYTEIDELLFCIGIEFPLSIEIKEGKETNQQKIN